MTILLSEMQMHTSGHKQFGKRLRRRYSAVVRRSWDTCYALLYQYQLRAIQEASSLGHRISSSDPAGMVGGGSTSALPDQGDLTPGQHPSSSNKNHLHSTTAISSTSAHVPTIPMAVPHCSTSSTNGGGGGDFLNAGLAGSAGKCVGGLAASTTNASTKLSPNERLERIMFELMETERCYVEDLDYLKVQYLNPLFSSDTASIPNFQTVVSLLIEHLTAILKFQRNFLEQLNEAVGHEFVRARTYPTQSQLRNALLHLGGVFINHSSKFKLYSSFCASQFKLQKILQNDEESSPVQGFLASLNVQRQHSCTLESMLIKPVQRVLRYPLFLQQMKSLTTQSSPEHLQMSEALNKMERVAEFINEMQWVYEEHGNTLAGLQAAINDPTISLDLSCLLTFNQVDWLNWTDHGPTSFDRPKKNRPQSSSHQSVSCTCFVFHSAIVLLGNAGERPPRAQANRKTSKDKTDLNPQSIHRLIPIREVEVNGSDISSSENHHIWTLVHMDAVYNEERVYHFSNRHPDQKQQFLKAIRRAGIAFHHRQMSSSARSDQSSCSGGSQQSTSSSSSFSAGPGRAGSLDQYPQVATPTTAASRCGGGKPAISGAVYYAGVGCQEPAAGAVTSNASRSQPQMPHYPNPNKSNPHLVGPQTSLNVAAVASSSAQTHEYFHATCDSASCAVNKLPSAVSFSDRSIENSDPSVVDRIVGDTKCNSVKTYDVKRACSPAGTRAVPIPVVHYVTSNGVPSQLPASSGSSSLSSNFPSGPANNSSEHFDIVNYQECQKNKQQQVIRRQCADNGEALNDVDTATAVVNDVHHQRQPGSPATSNHLSAAASGSTDLHKRPGSYHSNQSDAGYASNGESIPTTTTNSGLSGGGNGGKASNNKPITGHNSSSYSDHIVSKLNNNNHAVNNNDSNSTSNNNCTDAKFKHNGVCNNSANTSSSTLKAVRKPVPVDAPVLPM